MIVMMKFTIIKMNFYMFEHVKARIAFARDWDYWLTVDGETFEL